MIAVIRTSTGHINPHNEMVKYIKDTFFKFFMTQKHSGFSLLIFCIKCPLDEGIQIFTDFIDGIKSSDLRGSTG